MVSSLKDIAISNIDSQDETYKISTPTEIEGLTASIRHVGLLHPPILTFKQDQYTIISGFKRIEAARLLGFDTISARLVSAEAALLDCVRLAISDNLVHRVLNLVEVSRCISMLFRCFDDPAAVFDEARRLGISGNREYFQKVRQIGQFPDGVIAGLSEGRLSLSIAWELHRFGYDTADQLASLFRALKTNQNKQKEICTHLKEIALRESRTVQDVISDLGLADILIEPNLTSQQKTNAIRSCLRKRRFPHIYKALERSRHALKNLRLDKSVQIQLPEYFEDTRFTLQLSFRNKDDLEKHLAHLKRLIADPNLDRLLKR